MDHSVGIAPDGRGEMSVIVEGEAIMSDIMNAVFCLHHRPQSHSLDEFLLFLSSTLIHKAVKALGDGALGA